MAENDRPQLDPLVIEEIKQSFYRIDKEYWPRIEQFLVPSFIPLARPVPPQTPSQYLECLKDYARALFRVEADHYEHLRSNGNYPPWLSTLENRVVRHTQDAIANIEDGNHGMMLAYHGVSAEKIAEEVYRAVGEVRNYYIWKEAGPHIEDQSTTNAAPTQPLIDDKSPNNSPDSLAAVLKQLQRECDIDAEDIAHFIGVEVRSVYRHLAGEAIPRKNHLAKYEKLFSEKLGRPIDLKKSLKRHKNVTDVLKRQS